MTITKELQELQELIDRQAEDEALWDIPLYASEAYMQQELRELHAMCEHVLVRTMYFLSLREENECEWLIWSSEHNAWWRPKAGGYTNEILEAGRYPLQRAIDICYAANIAAKWSNSPVESMVPAPKSENDEAT